MTVPNITKQDIKCFSKSAKSFFENKKNQRIMEITAACVVGAALLATGAWIYGPALVAAGGEAGLTAAVGDGVGVVGVEGGIGGIGETGAELGVGDVAKAAVGDAALAEGGASLQGGAGSELEGEAASNIPKSDMEGSIGRGKASNLDPTERIKKADIPNGGRSDAMTNYGTHLVEKDGQSFLEGETNKVGEDGVSATHINPDSEALDDIAAQQEIDEMGGDLLDERMSTVTEGRTYNVLGTNRFAEISEDEDGWANWVRDTEMDGLTADREFEALQEQASTLPGRLQIIGGRLLGRARATLMGTGRVDDDLGLGARDTVEYNNTGVERGVVDYQQLARIKATKLALAGIGVVALVSATPSIYTRITGQQIPM